MNSINILNIKINPLKYSDFPSTLDSLFNKKGKSLICTVNTEFIIKAQHDEQFENILNNYSALNLADGIGPIWAAKFLSLKEIQTPILRELLIVLEWLGTILCIPIFPTLLKKPIPDRIAGSDISIDIAQYAADHSLRIFLLGGDTMVAKLAALKLQTDIYNLKIAGIHDGGPQDTKEIIEAVNKSRADILLVAFGAPKQEKWLYDNLKKTTCKIGIGVGGTFDFIAQIKKRAPRWMQKSGLEWLYRLIQEPSRLSRQMALPKFMVLVLIDKLKKSTN